MGSVIIREAPSRRRGCAAIYAPYVAQTSCRSRSSRRTPNQMAARIADAAARTHGWLLEVEDRVVGYAYGQRFAERAAYRWACVRCALLERERQRSGGGRLLLSGAVARLAERGYRRRWPG